MTLDFKEATSPIHNTIDFNMRNNTIDFNMRNNTIDFNMRNNTIDFNYGLHERYEHTTSIRY